MKKLLLSLFMLVAVANCVASDNEKTRLLEKAFLNNQTVAQFQQFLTNNQQLCVQENDSKAKLQNLFHSSPKEQQKKFIDIMNHYMFTIQNDYKSLAYQENQEITGFVHVNYLSETNKDKLFQALYDRLQQTKQNTITIEEIKNEKTVVIETLEDSTANDNQQQNQRKSCSLFNCNIL